MSHAIERARERYRLDLTLRDLQALTNQCRAPGNRLLGRGRQNSVEIRWVFHGSVRLKCVYDPFRHRINTFLAPVTAAEFLAGKRAAERARGYYPMELRDAKTRRRG